MASRLNNLFRVLSWSDFKRVASAAPGPGQSATAAHTSAGFSIAGGYRFDAVAGSKPVTYRLTDNVTMNIGLRTGESWAATWVFNRPQSEQDALLNHERGHYKIVALLARDFFWEIMALKPNVYPNSTDGVNEINQIQQGYSGAIIQSVHDAYDDPQQVDHDPIANANAQAIWDGLFASAISNKASLLDTLRAASVYP